jgi:hypothetical protein
MASFRSRILVSLVVLATVATISACERASPPARSEPASAHSAGQPVFKADVECGTYDGKGCAPTSERVDIARPKFSNPTKITNPLYPISALESAVLLGEVDGKPFRSETTLLPGAGTVMLDGQAVTVALSQYTAYLDGRITEVALDRFAQADDGSVWYLGEDVYDYDDQTGTVSVTEGTWLAGRDGPPAMIMPAEPKVGQVFRPEDIPGIVFEEVRVKEVGKPADGPLGKVEGTIVTEELHLDGSKSDKVFAPRYGEFYTASDGEVEALSLAVPADRVDGSEPIELTKLITGTWGLVESARLEDWEAVDATLARITANWKAVAASTQPVRVAQTLDAALRSLTKAVAGKQTGPVTSAAVGVAQSALDLELRYRTVAVVDIERFHLHTQQLRIDAAAANAAGVAAEVATLEWIRDRITGTLKAEELRVVDDELARLRNASNTGNLNAAADQAARLGALVRNLSLP